MGKRPTEGAFKVETVFIDRKPTAYNTIFSEGALSQVANHINENGLPLLLSHNSGRLPSGQWYEANNTTEQVIAKFFIPKEIREFEDVKTRIDTGILDSVSIGFSAKKHTCSICNNDINNYQECPHIPGREYEIRDDPKGPVVGKETCYVILDELSVSEGSLVYSGAVKSAKVIKSSDKAEFFEKNHFEFADGQLKLEAIHTKHSLQSLNEQKDPEGKLMDEKTFKELQTKHLELQEKFTELRQTNLTVQEKVLSLRTEVQEYKDKAEKYDTIVASLETKEAEHKKLFADFAEAVEKLAAPFKVDYKAPDNSEDLLADFETYMEKAKALPSGRQSVSEPDSIEYAAPEAAYKV